jgi:CSLREA domain-containing protein
MNRRKTTVLITLSLIIGIAMLGLGRGAKAKGSGWFESSSNPRLSKTFSARTVEAVKEVPPGMKLAKASELRPSFAGEIGFNPGLAAGEFRALTMAAYDFDADGAPELVSGYAMTNGGGALVLHRGSYEAYAPSKPESLRALAKGRFPDTFQKETIALELPEAPDFLGVGDFDRDGNFDLIAAARGGRALHLLAGDGLGEFAAERRIDLPGKVTAMATGEVDQLDGRADVMVGVTNDEASSLLVFNRGGVSDAPLSFSLPMEATAMATGQLDRDPAMDLAVAAGGRVWILHGDLERDAVDTTSSRLDEIAVPGYAREIALGDFIRDRAARPEMAVLTEDGGVQILSRGELDTRPMPVEELRARIETFGRGRPDESLREENRGILDRAVEEVKYAVGIKEDSWKVEESLLGAARGFGRDSSKARLIAARLSGQQAEDLLVMDGAKLNLLATRASKSNDEGVSFATGRRAASTLGEGEVVAAIAMRLNVFAEPGLVLLKEGSFPVLIPAAPAATLTVTKTADTNDGLCNADCSLREAIRAANAAAGSDMIVFTNVAGSPDLYTHTIAGINDNAGNTGDIDITDGITIVGNGPAETIAQAGPTAGSGIDKVFSINPSFTSAFASSLSGMTIRHGRNTSGFSGDGFGGGLDWDGSGTGTLAISNSTITLNTTADGDGGGLVATNGAGANPTTLVTISGSTISNNQPARVGAASPQGGGIFVGVFTSLDLTNCTITANNNNGSGGMGEGGGYFSFTQSNTEVLGLHGCTVTNNQAPSHGGGVRSTQRTTIDQNTVISGNISGGQGGGLFHNQNNTTASLITKTTFLNNSAVTSGGGIRLGSSTTNNAVNISFCRFAGNTAPVGSGLAVFNGVATAENNWWTCNAGPGVAPCQRAQIEAGGTGSLDFTPWIVLSFASSPASLDIPSSLTSTLTASFLQNSSGGAIAASNLDRLIGLPIAFNNPAPVLGNITAAQPTIQATGTATATYTVTAGGNENLEAVVDGAVVPLTIVIQAPPTITGAGALTRQQGVAASNSQIATVADPNQAANTLAVTVNGGASATVNGVTVNTITINAAGQVFANIAASCTATNATFTLTVTDATAKTATATLTVNVTANTPPTIGTYPATNVAPGASTTVTPNVAPTDNVTVVSLTASAPGFTGTFSGNPATGVLTITNANPAGVFTVTVIATDNCGATATTTFPLTVNNPPTITGATISRQQGTPVSNSQIATVSDANQAANTLAVVVNGGASATVSGVTVSGISIDGAGAVTASVVAACTASNASFTLTVTDNRNATATATLTVNVTANTPPTLGTYPASSVATGGSTTVTPSVAPTDNGSVTSLTATAPLFTGTLTGNPATGAISIANANPPGSYTVTVTATDNCGATTTATFSLTVGSAPTIAGATLSRQQGSPASSSQIATVSDADQAANTLGVTVNGAASATVNGVTVSGISASAAGVVTANVAADCTATNASFTLTVTDAQNNTANATLNVNVTANTPPALGAYAATSVTAGGSTMVTPSVAPSDNGSIASLTANAPGFTGTLSVNAAGVVSIANAGPAGPFTVTVTATDNCGASSMASFTLTVNAANNPPAITGATISRQQGSPASSSQIAAVSDADQAANTLAVSINTPTVNGVTVSGLSVNAAGAVTASVVASCTATNASFILTVTDNQSAMATAMLNVNVTANTAPAMGTYPAANVALGASTTVTPNAAPSDNGSIAGLTAMAPGFTGTLSVNAAGVVSVVNAGPAATFTVTVTATDNCGAVTTRTFALTVTGGGGCSVTVNPATLPQPYLAVPYVRVLSASPSHPAGYTFSVSAGALPPGLQLVTVFGVTSIAGLPATPGTFNFTIKAKQNNSTCEGTRGYTVTIPPTVVPILECVQRLPNGKYRAYFGYDNTTGAAVTIPVGVNNYFTPGNPNRGQTTLFQPGRVTNAFSVNFNASGSNLAVWFLKGPDGVLRPVNVTTASIGCP